MTSPTIYSPRDESSWTITEKLKGFLFPGKSKGTLGGSLVSDMSEMEKTLIMCGKCQHKFDYKRQGYYSVWRYENQPVTGECDICLVRITGSDGRIFIHDNMRHKVWVTPEEKIARATTKRRVAHTFRRR